MNESTDHSSPDRYLAPGWFTRTVFNPTVHWLARRGVSLMGSRELRVVGRTSGKTRTTVVNLLDLEGRRYLVAPRGTTQWVRNMRAADGVGELHIGRKFESFQATELDDDAKAPVLRAYVERWGWEVGQFFEGVGKSSTDDELAAIAPGFPVFRLD
ncbi:MAG TPA: nitroreductase/quinone reductase family protein [Acidimicrobiales bacterium]|nr:nitroreductase/quinone reductase family protein [Acidimicrobiales bacterium]